MQAGSRKIMAHINAVIMKRAVSMVGDVPSVVNKGNANSFCHTVQHALHMRMLMRSRKGNIIFTDARFFPSNMTKGVAQIGHMIHVNGGDGRDQWLGDNIGGIVASAQSRLQQQHIAARGGKNRQCRRGDDLKQRGNTVGLFALVQSLNECVIGDRMPIDHNAFIGTHNMRRAIDMNAVSRRLQHGAHKGDGGALAVRSCHMNGGRQAMMRIAQCREQVVHALQ